MITVRTIGEVRDAVDAAKDRGATIGFVPTMGYLHDGHLSLVDTVRAAGASFIVASVFVNPTQFGPTEDLSTYPRDEEGDARRLSERGTDLLFLPTADTIYPDSFTTTVSVSGVSEALEGSHRPRHFDGVVTVVAKLFNIVRPDIAIFGRKDAQQCEVIQRMVDDLAIPVRLAFGETVREPDGLAMSSRNAYLSETERALAPRFNEALRAGASVARSSAPSVDAVESAMASHLARHQGIEVDYLRVVDPKTFLSPLDFDRDLLLVGAVRIGSTRLIDNIRIEQPSHGGSNGSTRGATNP